MRKLPTLKKVKLYYWDSVVDQYTESETYLLNDARAKITTVENLTPHCACKELKIKGKITSFHGQKYAVQPASEQSTPEQLVTSAVEDPTPEERLPPAEDRAEKTSLFKCVNWCRHNWKWILAGAVCALSCTVKIYEEIFEIATDHMVLDKPEGNSKIGR